MPISREGKPPEDWHCLEDHLKNVAEMAWGFADDFNAGHWGIQMDRWPFFGPPQC